jgi:hypothetical protein
MHNHMHARMAVARKINLLHSKSLMYGTVSVPEDHTSVSQRFRVTPSVGMLRVPHGHLFQGYTHRFGGISAEMLVRKEENSPTALQGPT